MNTTILLRRSEIPSRVLAATKISPLLQFSEARAHRRLRLAAPTTPRPQLVPNAPFLARLRRAELDAWQATGGDYLRTL